MIITLNPMQSYENHQHHQRKRKSKSNACLHMPRFGRFTRFSRWTPKIQDTIDAYFSHSGCSSLWIQYNFQIDQNPSKFSEIQQNQ